MNIKMPSRENGERCVELRCRSKMGEHLSKEDLEFCRSMCNKYPEWYSATESRVFNETVPFGSDAKREEQILPSYKEQISKDEKGIGEK